MSYDEHLISQAGGDGEPLDAIQRRADKATKGPWSFDGTDITNIPDYKSDDPAPWTQVMECEVSCGSYCYGGSVNVAISPENRALIESAPADIRTLLALVREQAAKLGRVLELCDNEDARQTVKAYVPAAAIRAALESKR